MKIFIGLTAADGYKTLLSHLGPDPKVGSLEITSPAYHKNLKYGEPNAMRCAGRVPVSGHIITQTTR